MGYKKLAQELTKNKTKFLPIFPISPMNKTLNDFHLPKVFTMFPNPREPHYKDPQP